MKLRKGNKISDRCSIIISLDHYYCD